MLISQVLKLKNKGKIVIFVLDNPFGEELDIHSIIDRKIFSINYRPSVVLETNIAMQRGEPIRSRIKKIAAIQ